MFTIEEIKNAEFDKVMRGYKPEDVHIMLAQIASQLETAASDKADMEKKLYILAQKVEQYRGEEDMLKTAMLNAQRMGESVIREAKQKAESIIREADLKANLIDEQAKTKVAKEEKEYAELQHKVAHFKSEVLAIYKQHIESLSELPVDKETDDVNEVQDNSAQPVQEAVSTALPIDTVAEDDVIEYVQEPYNKSEVPTFDFEKSGAAMAAAAEKLNAINDTQTFAPVSDSFAKEDYADEKPKPTEINAVSFGKFDAESNESSNASIFNQYEKIDFND